MRILFIFLASFLFSKPTICLNMIVKDEAPVIERCLNSVKNLIDYWVIIDTGSSDGTQSIIQNFLKEIPGELHERKWVDFSTGRNQALELAKNKGDYLLFIDADEELQFAPNYVLPNLDKDCYLVEVQVENDDGTPLSAHRAFLINNHLPWIWQGVIHEELIYKGPKTCERLSGIVNRAIAKDGCRSRDANKYLKDAQTLERALEKEPQNSRYVFYLAQSYESGKDAVSALKNFEKRAQMGGSPQEIFWSLYRAACIKERLGAPDTIESFCKAYQFRMSRIEPLYYLASYLAQRNKAFLSYLILRYIMDVPKPDDIIPVEHHIYDSERGKLFAQVASEVEPAIPINLEPEELYNAQIALAALQEMENNPAFLDTYCAAFLTCPKKSEPLIRLSSHFSKNKIHILTYLIGREGIKLSDSNDLLFEFANAAYELEKCNEAAAVYKYLLAKSDLPFEMKRQVKKQLAFCNCLIFAGETRD